MLILGEVREGEGFLSDSTSGKPGTEGSSVLLLGGSQGGEGFQSATTVLILGGKLVLQCNYQGETRTEGSLVLIQGSNLRRCKVLQC